ncbi:GNAT family N-acetyltransferase [Halostagnicola kamekurae]|uniref:Acetyltransferase (GNAT) family protein n=1 Tax=Halostagnicola kamekurae TaxID=619731 RepID=A0A1I6PT03_9EURY|nr:GNAT family N-acetyltransferase [Halostagnicola kamekurae]SFS43377.1 Acetyltransferase (GNAT) family protein [Halostagnicola kamekurae]
MPRIRSATLEDVRAISRIARRSWHAAYDDILGPETVEKLTDRWYAIEALEESLEQTAERDTGAFLVADSEFAADDKAADTAPTLSNEARSASVVGFVQGTAAANSSEPPENSRRVAVLNRIYVDPDSWDDGVGSALVTALEETLDDSFETLRVHVLAGNDVGISFYESTGFERVETRITDLEAEIDETEIDAPLEEHVYEKPL